MSDLPRERIRAIRDGGSSMARRAAVQGWLITLCDMALRTLDAEARNRKLEIALRDCMGWLPTHRSAMAREEYENAHRLIATPPPDSEPAEGAGGGETCPACPLEVRNLYACASNMFRRWDRRDVDGMEPVERKMESLRRAVRLFKPYIDQHFTDRDHYERSRRTREEYLAGADHILSEHGRHKTYNEQGEHNAPPQRRDAGDILREKLSDPKAMQRVTERAAERQDAMLGRRDALSIKCPHCNGEGGVMYDVGREGEQCEHCDGAGYLTPIMAFESLWACFRAYSTYMEQSANLVRQALSRTSDEGTGYNEVAGEVYQAVGVLLSDAGRFDDPDGIALLDACSYLAGNRDNPPGTLLPFESKGTGCVVPEAIKRLPERWRRRALGSPAVCADELDRALPQPQEEQ